MKTKKDLKKLIKTWKKQWRSAVVPKKEISAFTGGLMAPQTLTNLISQGKAPKPFYIRGRAVYEIDVLLDWLLKYITSGYEGFEICKETPNYKGVKSRKGARPL